MTLNSVSDEINIIVMIILVINLINSSSTSSNSLLGLSGKVPSISLDISLITYQIIIITTVSYAWLYDCGWVVLITVTGLTGE